MQNIKLSNGLNVIYYPMMNTHSVTLGLYVKSGIAYEDEAEVGITHFLEHLHFRRIGSLPQKEMYYEIERLGSSMKCTTYTDFIQFSVKVVPEKVLAALSVFRNIFSRTEWTSEEFQKEKQIVLNQIKERDNYFYINDEKRQVIFKDTGLAERIVGDYEKIKRLEKEKVQEYRNAVFNYNNMFFCITGCVDEQNLKKIMNDLNTLQIVSGKENLSLEVPKVFHNRKPDINLVQIEDDIVDVNLSFDISGDSYSKEIVQIINCILGEGTGSKLQNKIREEEGYTFDIYSYLEEYKNFAVLHICFSVEKDLFVSCLKEVIQVIKELKKCITKKDLEVSLPFYTTNKMFGADDTERMNLEMAFSQFIWKGKEQIDISQQNDKELLEKVQENTRKIFVPENACVVIVGDMTNIKKKDIKKYVNDL